MSLLSVVKDVAVKIGTEVIKHQAEVLLVGGVTLAVGATVATVKATSKSVKDIQEENLRREENDEPEMTKTEVVKREAKNYILPVLLLAASLGCQFGGYKASIRRAAALSAALKISEKTFEEYKKDVEEQAEKLAPEELKTAIKEAEPKAKESAMETVIFSGDTEYCVRIDGYRLKKNIAQLKLDLETFRSKYYLSGYQDPVTVADLHDYIGVHVAPSDYDRKIDFSGEERWYTLEPSLENSQLFVDIDYTTRDIEKY